MKQKRVKFKFATLVVAMALLVGSFSGCKKTEKTEEPVNSVSDNGKVGSANQEKSAETTEFSYPIAGDKKITMNWGDGREVYDTSEMKDWYKDYNWMQTLKDKTGVTLIDLGGKYGSTAPSDEFMLLLAGGEYPDIFRANWISFPGGPSAALKDGYIISLNDVIDQYMPNFKKFLEDYPEIAKMITTDDGIYYTLPVINENPEPAMGLTIRQDWLDKLGVGAPKTLDELHDVLTRFKTELNCKTPLTFELRWMFQQYGTASLSSSFEALYPFYVKDGKVKFGPLEENYKEFLTMMNQWYKEGLIDADVASVDKNTVQSKFASGEAGASIQMLSNNKNAIVANESTDPNFKVVALNTLVKSEGDTPLFSSYNGMYTGDAGFSISTACKDIETVARWMDFMYSEEGNNILKYGIEGVTYEMVDGKVVYTDFILNNPNESNPSTVLGYVTKNANWPQFVSKDYVRVREDYETNILNTWATEMEQYLMPAVTFTEEESGYINQNYSNIDTYARENITKYVLGTEDLANYDSFIKTLKQYGIDKVLEYRQAAYDRYIAR